MLPHFHSLSHVDDFSYEQLRCFSFCCFEQFIVLFKEGSFVRDTLLLSLFLFLWVFVLDCLMQIHSVYCKNI